MVFIWVERASNASSAYEIKNRKRQVQELEKTNPTEAVFKDETDTLTLSDEYQEAAGRMAYSKASKRKASSKDLLASDVMSSPVLTLFENSTLKEALEFVKLKRFRHVPVVNGENKLSGILSDRDFFKFQYETEERDKLSQTKITELIKSRVLTASPDTKISEIARIMFDERIGAMPVLDSEENIVGMITRSDILRTILKRESIELLV
jgi:acetoin utilization protein AcuB